MEIANTLDPVKYAILAQLKDASSRTYPRLGADILTGRNFPAPGLPAGVRRLSYVSGDATRSELTTYIVNLAPGCRIVLEYKYIASGDYNELIIIIIIIIIIIGGSPLNHHG